MIQIFKTMIVMSWAMLATAVWAQDGEKPILCPVNKMPVVAGGPVIETMGLKFEFCCPGCDLKLKAEPDKYLEQAREDGNTVAVSLFDPVAYERIDRDEAKAAVDYQGVRYYFQSEENRDEFLMFPELFAQVPPQESLMCPVMKNAVSTYSLASGYADYENVRYYFCCAGCDTKFAEDPAKYAATVTGHVRSRTGEALAVDSKAMQMAPTCAGCAGEARLLGPDGVPTQWTIGYRYIGIEDVKSRHRWTVDYMVTPNLSVGLERAGSDSRQGATTTLEDGFFDWLRLSDGDTTVLPRATWFVSPERPNHPSMTLGFASDRLSTPRGQAFFSTFAKSIPGSNLTPFVSMKVNSFDGKTVFPFGVNYYLDGGWAVQAINDGDYSHVLLTKMLDSASVSLIWARTQYLGFSVTFGF